MTTRTTKRQAEADRAHREGRGHRQPAKPQRSSLWRKSPTTDPDPAVYRTRHATRRTAQPWGGHFAAMLGWPAGAFLNGRGLAPTGRYSLYVQGRVVGYTDDPNHGLGYARAATRAGLTATLTEG